MRKLVMVIAAVIMSFTLVGCGESVIEVSQYTLEYLDYDGTVLQTADYDFDADLSNVTAPTDPERPGYTFDSWSGTVPATMGEESVTLIAMYTVNQYMVEYVDYDGTVLETEDYNFGADLSGVIAPTDPERLGYTFDSWSGTLPATMGEETITLTALYSMTRYTISYDLDGGKNAAGNESSYNIEDDTITLLVPRKTGSTFLGWYDTSDFSGNVVTEISSGSYENKTLYAKWEVNEYTVEYIDHDGTVLQTADYEYGVDLSGVTAPTKPTRLGYTFYRWGGTVPETMEATKVTITALYTINKYTIRYNLDGGINHVGNVTAYNIESRTITLEAAKKAGATFLGWYDNSSFRGFAVTTIPHGSYENITLYAKWDMDEYTVEYVDYDGTVLQTEDYDFGADLSGITEPTDPSREGYTFNGWDTAVPATMGTSKVTIAATYTIKQYTLEYVDYDGTVLQTEDYDFGADLSGVTPPIDPSREGYEFSGWSITRPLTMRTTKITVTAMYTINKYAVEYIDYDGTVLQTEDYDFGADLSGITEPTDPSREGYTFNGWDTTVPTTMGTSKVTIAATYNVLPLTFTVSNEVMLYDDWGGKYSSSVNVVDLESSLSEATLKLYKGDWLASSISLQVGDNSFDQWSLDPETEYILKVEYTYTPQGSSTLVSETITLSTFTITVPKPTVNVATIVKYYYNGVDYNFSLDDSGFEDVGAYVVVYSITGTRIGEFNVIVSDPDLIEINGMITNNPYIIKLFADYYDPITGIYYSDVFLGQIEIEIIEFEGIYYRS